MKRTLLFITTREDPEQRSRSELLLCRIQWLPGRIKIQKIKNGLLRQYFPKGTDLSEYAQRDLTKVAEELNNRPRKSLGYRTPAEVMSQQIRELNGCVALHT